MQRSYCGAIIILMIASFQSTISAQTTMEFFSQEGLKWVIDYDLSWAEEPSENTFFYTGMEEHCGKQLLVHSDKRGAFLHFMEIIDSRVYLGRSCDNLSLLYDFSLEPADNVEVISLYGTRQLLVVLETKIVELLDGVPRRYLKLRNADQEIIEWVEGIGDIAKGMFNDKSESGTLKCVSTDDGSIYIAQDFSEVACESRGCLSPVVSFSYRGDDQLVSLKNESENVVSYSWDFGDGTSSTEQEPVHSYSTPGCYLITLETENECGEIVSTDKTYNACVDSIWTLEQRDFEEHKLFNAVSFGSEDRGLAHSGDSLYRSVDGGLTWQVLAFEEPNATERPRIGSILMYDEEVGFAGLLAPSIGGASAIGTVWATYDGGSSWGESIANFEASHIIYSDSRLIAAGAGKLMISDDLGQTWVEKRIPEEAIFYGIHSVGENIFGTSNNGSEQTLSVSTDMGETWEVISLAEDVLSPADPVHFVNATTGYVGTRNEILKTTDAGQTWSRYQLPFESRITEINFLDELNGWAMGSNIFRTWDGGETWELEYCQHDTSPSSVFVRDINVTQEGKVLVYFTSKGLFRYNPDPNFECAISSTYEANSEKIEPEIFPNPSNGRIQIENSFSSGYLSIYNNTGVELLRRSFDAGSFELQVEELPAGIYFLQLFSNQKSTRMVKFVKI